MPRWLGINRDVQKFVDPGASAAAIFSGEALVAQSARGRS